MNSPATRSVKSKTRTVCYIAAGLIRKGDRLMLDSSDKRKALKVIATKKRADIGHIVITLGKRATQVEPFQLTDIVKVLRA